MNTHNSFVLSLTSYVCIALLCTATLFADPLASSEVVAERLSDHWLSSAQQIRLPDKLILYHGKSDGSYTADGNDWVGNVQGEILILQADTAEACPWIRLLPREGVERTDPNDPHITIGPAKTILFLHPTSVAKESALSPAQSENWRKYLSASAPKA